MKISDVAIDRPVFTTMCAIAIFVMGGLALSRLGVDLFPDVSFPVVAISTTYPGAGPEEVEQQVTKRIEDAVSTINGVDTIRSFSRDSVSVVIVMFDLDVNELEANSDIRDRVQQVKALLPEDAEDPIMQKFDPSSAPIMTYSVRAPKLSPIETTRLVDDKIRPALESVEGVGSIVVKGGSEREIQIDLDQSKLQALGLSVFAVSQILRAESFDLPGGRLTFSGREFSIRAAGRFTSTKDAEETVLINRPDGTQIRVKDVGVVVDGIKEQRTLARVDGQQAVMFDVQKQSGANTVAVSDGVLEVLEKVAPTLGDGVEMTLVNEQAKHIRNTVNRLREHLIVGGILAIFVIFFFMLDVRSTLISATALPTSVIATFFVMWQLGFSLNMMSMLALTLSIGLLIDDSVVVRENIFRHLEMGADPVTAARKGTSEIALAVFATTMTIVAVFLPVAFMDGIVGKFFKQFGLTLTAAVLVSLVISFTLDPMLSARIAQRVDPNRHEKMRKSWFYGPPTRLFEWMDNSYRNILRWALGHKKTVVAGAALMFFSSLALVGFMGTEFMARGDQGKFQVTIEAPPGISLAESERIAKQAEQLLDTIAEKQTVITTVGVDRNPSTIALIVIVSHKHERERTLQQIMDDARARLSAIPGMSLKFGIPGAVDGGNAQQAPVQIIVVGPDLKKLEEIGTELMMRLAAVPGAVDVAIDLKAGSPEQRFTVNRSRAADRGVSFSQAGTALRFGVEGDLVASIADGGDDIDVRVRLREEDRANVARLKEMVVASRSGGLVRLDEIVDVAEVPTPSSITRNGRQRAVTISSGLAGRSLGEVMTDVRAITDDLGQRAGHGYAFKFEGEAENMADTFTNMLVALGLAVIFIYLILASQFESFVHPFTIMLALPLAVIGALAGLFLAGVSIGMPAMIGIILLMGLVTKNGILLVDYTNQVRERTGKNATEALIEAAPVRLRPILMTSSAIVLGELPTALSTAEGSEFNVPMAVAVIGGVITSTLLTLVVVPVVYTWIDKLSLKKYHDPKHPPPSSSAHISTPAE